MFWRGGMSPTGYWNRDGWYGRGPVLGQADTECVGDVCILVASRLNAANAKLLSDQMQFASGQHPECVEQAGGSELFESIREKVQRAVSGATEGVALTAEEADFVTRFQACIAPLMPATPPSVEVAGIPVTTLLVGGAALAALALVVTLAK